MSLAGGREPRKTAGNRMSKLLDAEEEDEFYKTTYGGFNDVSKSAVDMSTRLQSSCLFVLPMTIYKSLNIVLVV